MDDTPRPRRRMLLGGAAVAIGSVLGAAGLARETGKGDAAPSSNRLTMTLHGWDWHLKYPDRPRGVTPNPGERSASYGQLFDGPDGAKVGEFYASSFNFGSPFGNTAVSASAMEMHHFNFADGTIVGMGTIGGYHDEESVHAIIGGTGRYEGASGSYVGIQNPIELGGDGSARFTFNVTLRSV